MSQYFSHFQAPVEVFREISFAGFQARISRSVFQTPTAFEHCEPVHRVIVTLAGQTRSTVANIENLPTVKHADRPGAVTVVPAGMKRQVLMEDGDLFILNMAISDDFIQSGADEPSPKKSKQLRAPTLLQNGRNDWLSRIAGIYRDAALNGASEMLMQTLSFAIARHITNAGKAPNAVHGLDPKALSRLISLMQDRLGGELTLTDLAEEAGLSVSAFSRAFEKSLGTTPYRYFSKLRMQRAKELLAQGDQPMAIIAGEVGYTDQAHFTAAFTRLVGVSPGRWRSGLRLNSRFLPISRKTKLQRVE